LKDGCQYQVVPIIIRLILFSHPVYKTAFIGMECRFVERRRWS